MANNYYNFTPSFVPGTKVRSDEMNTQLAGIEAAFDNLPSDITALTRGVQILGVESGSGNAYVVTMPDTRTSYQEGDRVIFKSTHGNTGAATINIDSVGVVALVGSGGVAVVSGDLPSGTYFEAIYIASGNHFQLTGPTAGLISALNDRVSWATEWAIAVEDTPVTVDAGGDGSTTFSALHWAAKGATSASNAATSETNAATSETNSALNVGYASEWAITVEDTPVSVDAGGDGATTFSALHWAAKAAASAASSGLPTIVGGDALKIVRVNAGETAYELAAAGAFGNITIQGNEIISTDTNGAINIAPDGTGVVNLVRNTDTVLSTHAEGVIVRGSTAGDPTVPDAITTLLQIGDQDGVLYADIGYQSDTILDIINRAHGAAVRLQGENAAGTVTTLLSGDPDDSLSVYYAGTLRMLTQASGIVELRSDGNTDTEVRQVAFAHQNGTLRAEMGHNSFASFDITNRVHSGGIRLLGEDSGGINRRLVIGDPDGSVELYYADTLMAQTDTAANGGFQANNTLTGGGFERVITESDKLTVAARKTSNTTRANDATSSDDPHLQATASEAATTHKIDILLNIVGSGGLGGMRWDIDLTGATEAGSHIRITEVFDNTGIIHTDVNTTTGDTALTTAELPAATQLVRITYNLILSSSAAPTFRFQWAQETSDAAGLTLAAGSSMTVTAIPDGPL